MQANITDPSIYQDGEDLEQYWSNWAKQLIWDKLWQRVLEWQPPRVKWFEGGQINASVNCLDRHILPHRHPNKPAIIWEGEPGDKKTFSYIELFNQVNRCANMLISLGVVKGSRVVIYLPMIPEIIIATLACARIGAIHSVVFAGLGTESLKVRINDLSAVLVITADFSWRKGKLIPLKKTVDLALTDCPTVKNTVVVKREVKSPYSSLYLKKGRDILWNEQLSKAGSFCPPVTTLSEDPLFVLYTSGTTGKPKGLVHTTGGYLTQTYATSKWIFDFKPDDVYWCTADIGWITGHSYVIYGPLMNGATVFIYEGSADWPDKSRYWQMIEQYKISILYTAPTVIRMFMKWEKEYLHEHNLSSLRLLGSVGEPINPAAWRWYYQNVGRSKCPIVDTWWQTETGAIMISPIPGITSIKPGSATRPFPGIQATVLNKRGESIVNRPGYLAVTKPWPAMARTIWRDNKRYVKNYWSKWSEQIYFTGDCAVQDENGYFWLQGRIDDVIQVAGHRLSSAEIESSLIDHKAVAESAVVGVPDSIKGEVIIAFVTLKSGFISSRILNTQIIKHISDSLGPIVKPKSIIFVDNLPKTRSGKIMRRLLRAIASNKPVGNVATLSDPSIIRNLQRSLDHNPNT